MQRPIAHQETGHRGAFYIEQDGERLAEMTYSRAGRAHIIIDHTEVSPALRGEGVGRQLLDVLVEWARTTKTKVSVTCPFARAQFEKDPALRDVLA